MIHGATLEVADGEFVVFVGPSGCGKSTLLRMIAGLEDISGGEVRIGGTLVNDVEPADRGTAMVFQSYALYPHMTVEENLSFGLRMNGNDKADTARRVAQGRRDPADHAPDAAAARASSPAASASGSRSAGRSCASPRSSSSTSRSPTSTPSSGCRCASSSRGCTPSSA